MHRREIIAIFMAIGALGNGNVIVAIARKKSLRTKNVMFILFLSIAHLVCNISELITLLEFHLLRTYYSRCFKYDKVYSFFMDFQSSLYLTMAIDLFFSIVMPVKYKVWNTTCYIVAMLTFPIGLSVFYQIISNVSVPYHLRYLFVFCIMATLLIIIVSVCSAIIKSKFTQSNSSRTGRIEEEEEIGVFLSTFFMVLIYVGSWLTIICTAMIDDSNKMNYYLKKTHKIEFYMTLIVVPTYCQTYFVSFFWSPKLRKAYQEQLHWITCGILFPNIFEAPQNRVVSTSNLESNDESDCEDTLIRGQL